MKELLERSKQTPIEILLQVDGEGKTTAKALYEFLELDTSHYARWCKKNILENSFTEENVDFWAFALNGEWGGQATTDYKLTASFAKKLAMSSQTERGEQAREYFVKIEEKFKKVVSKKVTSNEEQKAKMMRAEAMLLNAKNRTFKTLMQSIDNKKLSPIAIEVFGLKTLEGTFGVDVGNYLPKIEKTYSATDVGKILGISANMVGKIANANNLKTEEYGIFALDKSRYSNKEVESFRYNQKGVDALKEFCMSK